MKKITLLFMMILSTVSYSQTPITEANFQTAINTCLVLILKMDFVQIVNTVLCQIGMLANVTNMRQVI